MKIITPAVSCRRRERGVALLVALLLMLAILATSIAAARTAISGARAAGHERDRLLALHAAMAALADAEHDIEGGADPASSRAAALGSASPGAFAGGCRGGAPYDGLCAHAPGGGSALFAALADDEGPGVELGAFTGAHMPTGEGALAARSPRYLIELMPSPPGAMLYRVTALGFGSAGTAQVAVQSYYRKVLAAAAPGGAGPPAPPPPGNPDESVPPPDPPVDPPSPANPGEAAPPGVPPAPGMPGGPGIRVAWREISNWHEALAQAGVSARTERQ